MAEAFEAGIVRIFTDDTEEPHCYGVWAPTPSLFTGVKAASVLSIFIKPEYRGGRLLFRMIRHIREEGARCGCKEITFSIPRQMTTHGVFRKLCGEPTEFLYRLEI